MKSNTCPICRSQTKYLFSKYDYEIWACNICKHKSSGLVPSGNHVQKYYSDSYFFGGNSGYPNYLYEESSLTKRGQYYEKLVSKYIGKGFLLDVGAAAGFILKAFIDRGWTGNGVEPNHRMANHAKEVLGLEVEQTSLEQFEMGDHQYDLALLVQVIGHVYNLEEAISKINKALRPEGLLLIETWNSNSLMAKTLGKYWHEYSPPTVLNYFTKKSLDMFITQHGYKKVQSRTIIKKISGLHAKSLLNYKYVSRPNRIKSRIISIIPNRIMLPYISDDLFWVLYKRTDSLHSEIEN